MNDAMVRSINHRFLFYICEKPCRRSRLGLNPRLEVLIPLIMIKHYIWRKFFVLSNFDILTGTPRDIPSQAQHNYQTRSNILCHFHIKRSLRSGSRRERHELETTKLSKTTTRDLKSMLRKSLGGSSSLYFPLKVQLNYFIKHQRKITIKNVTQYLKKAWNCG